MHSIAVKNISKAFPNKDLFEAVSFTIGKQDRIAIVGENGIGKSTLVQIVAGLVETDDGRVIREKCSVAYIPQEFSGDTSLLILEYLEVMQASPKVFEIIKQFGIVSERDMADAYLSALSGGQQRVIEIAAVLSTGPMILCIDEPENHLDIRVRQILTELLQSYWGGVLFVSHDRYLVNAVANQIVALEAGTSVLTTDKTYEEYIDEKLARSTNAADAWTAEHKQVERLEANVRMLRHRTTYSDAQAKTYQQKKRELAKRKEELGNKPLREPKKAAITTNSVERNTGKLIVAAEGVSFGYEQNKLLFKDLNLDIRFGQKVVLLGRNGSGKTSCIELLRGNVAPSAGIVKQGVNLSVVYVDQHNTLDDTLTPIDHVSALGMIEQQARSRLAQLLFSQGESETIVANLSRGQQLRLRFALVFQSLPDFIILDEPTNNLDPTTWELLLELVNQYTGTVLLVSHDRSFVEAIADKRVFVLAKQAVSESWAELDEILEKL